jgi:hypothetical protein
MNRRVEAVLAAQLIAYQVLKLKKGPSAVLQLKRCYVVNFCWIALIGGGESKKKDR